MATVTFNERKISITLVKPVRVIRMEPAAKRTIALGQKPIRTIRLSNVGIQGSQGFSAFEVWQKQPGNALKDEQDYLDWLANAQIVVVTPYLTATQAARDVALDASATAVAAKNAAGISEVNALTYKNTSIDRAIAALAAQEAAELARSQAQAEKNAATVQREAADYAAEQAAAAALTADADAATANNAKDAAAVSAQASEAARAASVAAKVLSEAGAVTATAKAFEAGNARDGAVVAQDAAEDARDVAIAKALEAATLAAEFDGDTYDRKTDLLASSRLTGMIDPGLIPVLVGQLPVVSSGTIANLTAPQQAGIAAGTLVATVDGRRWVYKGSGSKIDSSNYIEQGDVTPDWTTIANKPTNFVVVDAENTLQGTLTLAAGTAAAAPLKFQAGVQLTVAVPHAVEWTGAALSITTAAGVRKTIAYTDSNITGSAASLTTARSISMTGDGTWTTSFNGSANVTGALTLATVNANVGAFGSATQVPTFTVDAKGRTTAAANVTITPAWSSITAKPTTLAGYGITDALTSTYVPAWAAVTGKPTTVAGYGITDALTTSYVPTWASVSGKPTTLAGYGITDNAAISGTGQTVTFGRVDSSSGFVVGGQAGYLYPSAGDVVLRYGVNGTVKYASFTSDGNFNVSNGGVNSASTVYAPRYVAHGDSYVLRMKSFNNANGYGAMFYKDSATLYLLLTNNNDADGGFNGLRPFYVNLASGLVSMANGLSVNSGGLSVIGDSSLNGTVNIGGAYLELSGAAGQGAAGAANTTLIRRGSMELKEANPYLDLARGTNDWDLRLQSVAGGNGYLYASSHLVVEAQNGGVVFVNGGSGRQSGEIVSVNGTQQTMAKSLGFVGTGNPFTGSSGYTTEIEIRGAGGTNPAVISFHRPGAYGAFFGLRSDDEFAVGGWSMGGNSWKVWTQRNFDPATKLNTDSLDVGIGANKVAIRDGEGSINVRSIKTTSVDGEGLKMWGGSDDFKVYMSAEGSAAWGGNVANAEGADYNTYFRMAGAGRGWVFFNGAAKLKISGDGALTAQGAIRTNEWFRQYGAGGYFNHTYAQGFQTSGAAGNPYGNITPYGVGSNGWSGINLIQSGLLTWMCNADSVGLHHNGNSWLMSSDMAGNWTFRGNVTAFSDLRLKNVLGGIDNAKERRDNLAEAAIMYTRKDNESGRIRLGYGAQTLRDGANPELVLEADDAMKVVTGTGTLSVDYGEATAILAVASKETDDEVARLRKQVEELSRLVARLLDDGK
jgi:hypothetical protein